MEPTKNANVCFMVLWALLVQNVYICVCVCVCERILPAQGLSLGLAWFVGFYGISTFVGYLTPNPFLYK